MELKNMYKISDKCGNICDIMSNLRSLSGTMELLNDVQDGLENDCPSYADSHFFTTDMDETLNKQEKLEVLEIIRTSVTKKRERCVEEFAQIYGSLQINGEDKVK